MKVFRITEPQSSFVQVELLGRYLLDDDDYVRDTMETVLDHYDRSHGRVLAVPDEDLMRGLVLDVINFIDDEIENYHKGDRRALSRIGVDTAGEARGLHRTGESLLKKMR